MLIESILYHALLCLNEDKICIECAYTEKKLCVDCAYVNAVCVCEGAIWIIVN